MNRSHFLTALLLGALAPAVFAQTVQYISDDITLSLRDAPRNDARVIASVRSGQKVSVLEVLGEDSFARIRIADGREGWMTARYLSRQPAAKDRQLQIKAELDAAQAQIVTLQTQLKDASAQLAQARPALELSRDNERLKNELRTKEESVAALAQTYNVERERRATLVTGATLVAGGIGGGLLLPWLWQLRRRRRWGDF